MSASRGMPHYWGRFKKDRFFLSAYFLKRTLFLGLLLVALLEFGTFLPAVTDLTLALAFVPIGILLGIKLPTLMHNGMHGNLGRANDAIGELTSFFILLNFPIVCLQHTLHHAYPDTEDDPHNPEGLGFWNYFATNQFRGAGITQRKFLDLHGRSLVNVLLFKLNIALHFAGSVLTLAVFYLFLGKLFFWFYLPAFFSYLFVFSHVNYYSHGRDEEGRPQIRNLNTNLYYKFINFLCDGIYFHRNHHVQPALYNPQYTRRNP
jgi:fatty acid desaturase